MINLRDIMPALYSRIAQPEILGTDTAAKRRTLKVYPTSLVITGADVNIAATSIDLNTAASWDTTSGTDYTVAANRAGKDFYLYAVSTGLVLSVNATVPTGYTSDTSRKIGGFHCLCLSVGTISGHSLSGFLTGDILPASIWDLIWRPVCSPEGMVYSALADVWVDIYLQSGTGSSTRSAYDATITDTRAYNDHADDLAAVGKRMLTDLEFQAATLGTNEQTNIAGSSDPVTTGGHRDTTGATNGTSTSGATPSTDISAAANPQTFNLGLCGRPAVTVSINPSGLNTGALIAAALQTAIRAAIPWAGGLTVTYGTTYVISCPGSWGESATVVVTSGTTNDCTTALKLGVAKGGTEVAGNLGRRMISNIGVEDAAGAMYQWVDGGFVYRNGDASYSGSWGWTSAGASRGQYYVQGGTGVVGLLAGGSWACGSSCGSRCRYAANARSSTSSSIGSRGCARSRGA